MEKALVKMARQLRSLDEASLMSLWEKYAGIVRAFEPSERWEEAVLVLSFIQSVRMKNQLFNHQWAGTIRPREPARPEAFEPAHPLQPAQARDTGLPAHARKPSGEDPRAAGPAGGSGKNAGSGPGPARGNGSSKRGKLVRFRSRDEA